MTQGFEHRLECEKPKGPGGVGYACDCAWVEPKWRSSNGLLSQEVIRLREELHEMQEWAETLESILIDIVNHGYYPPQSVRDRAQNVILGRAKKGDGQ